MPTTFLLALIAALASPFIVAGVVYRVWLRTLVRLHFGEELSPRRDREASARRGRFERHCIRAASFLYFVPPLDVARGLMKAPLPQLGLIALAAEVFLLVLTAISVWQACACWEDPCNNGNHD